MKKLIIGVFVSVAFLYFSLEGIELNSSTIKFEGARYIFLLPAVMLSIVVLILRSLRLATILSPVQKISQRILFPLTCVGFMGIAIIPLRIGELIRPYLVGTNSRVPISTAMATIFVERMLDSLVLAAMIFVVIFFAEFSQLVVKTGCFLFVIFIFILVIMYLIYFYTRTTIKALGVITGFFSERLRTESEKIFFSFAEGLKIIASPRELIQSVLLSILIWVASGLIIYILFIFSNFQIPLVGAFAVLVITVLGISLPAAPGFLGTFQFGCIFALSLFNISRPEALSFSIVYYFTGIGINVIAGLLFLPFFRISFHEIRNIAFK